jgi:hypothetical protein
MTSSEGRNNDNSDSSRARDTCAKHVAEALRFVAHKRWNAAQAALLRAWERSKHDDDPRNRSLCCRLLAELYRMLGNTGSARQFLQLALGAESSAWGPVDCEFSSEVLAAAAREHVANDDHDNAFRLLEAAACREDCAASLAVAIEVGERRPNTLPFRGSVRRASPN